MDNAHIAQMIDVMIACHGEDAEHAARKRASRCLRRKEPEWAALWRAVADRIAAAHFPRAPTATRQEPLTK